MKFPDNPLFQSNYPTIKVPAFDLTVSKFKHNIPYTPVYRIQVSTQDGMLKLSYPLDRNKQWEHCYASQS